MNDQAAVTSYSADPPIVESECLNAESFTAQTRLGFLTLAAYGTLALPLSLAEIPIIVYLPAFYAKELHISAGLVGIVFLLARVWDGVADVFIGWLSDRSSSRWGRRKPWTIVAAPFLMGALWFLCNPPRGAGLLYLAICAVLFYPAWTAVKIPYIAWGAELASDYIERSRVTTIRETFMMLGSLLFSAAPILFLPANAPLRDVLFMIAFIVVCLMPLSVLLLAARVPDPVPIQRVHMRLTEGLAALAKDRVLIRFIFATLCIWTSEGVINSLAVFSFGLGLQQLFWVILLLYVSMLGAVPGTLRLARRVDKHRLMAGGIAIYVLALTAMIWIPQGHFLPIAAAWTIAGIANAPIWALPTAVLADIADHGEVLTGQRRSGAYAAVYYLIVKLGLALGVGISFGLLECMHYDPSASSHTAADAANVRLLGFGLPALMYAVALVLYLTHPITRSVHARLRHEINSRQVEVVGAEGRSHG